MYDVTDAAQDLFPTNYDGLATGLLLSALGPVVWLFVPAKADSRWKRNGPFGRTPRPGRG